MLEPPSSAPSSSPSPSPTPSSTSKAQKSRSNLEKRSLLDESGKGSICKERKDARGEYLNDRTVQSSKGVLTKIDSKLTVVDRSERYGKKKRSAYIQGFVQDISRRKETQLEESFSHNSASGKIDSVVHAKEPVASTSDSHIVLAKSVSDENVEGHTNLFGLMLV